MANKRSAWETWHDLNSAIGEDPYQPPASTSVPKTVQAEEADPSSVQQTTRVIAASGQLASHEAVLHELTHRWM